MIRWGSPQGVRPLAQLSANDLPSRNSNNILNLTNLKSPTNKSRARAQMNLSRASRPAVPIRLAVLMIFSGGLSCIICLSYNIMLQFQIDSDSTATSIEIPQQTSDSFVITSSKASSAERFIIGRSNSNVAVNAWAVTSQNAACENAIKFEIQPFMIDDFRLTAKKTCHRHLFHEGHHPSSITTWQNI